jgi:hypothetical protein
MPPRKPEGLYETAVKLSRSPLGIIALAFAFVYAMASLALAFGGHVTESQGLILVWFLVLFPVVLFIGFYLLVANHHAKLYAPGDFKDESAFVRVMDSYRTTPPPPDTAPPTVPPPTTSTTTSTTTTQPPNYFKPVYGMEAGSGSGPFGLELMILNTLWIHQVNLSPTFEQQWCFRLNANSPAFLHFREASTRLIARSLVTETDQGMICLTHAGFAYCKLYYCKFPDEQYYPETPMNPINLKEALRNQA